MGSLRVEAAGMTHVGMKRKQNQDSYLLIPELNLFIVADGMGGHKGGETASLLATSTIGDYFRAFTASPTAQDPVTKLCSAITAANEAIQARGSQDATLQGMGTTTCTLYFANDRVYIGHVGDSRCYLAHPGRIWQITRDHSLVQEKLRAGLITRDQLKTDKMKNVITRSVGFENRVEVDVYEIEPHRGDAFVLCSDGLSGMIDDNELSEIVSEQVFKKNALQACAQKLVDRANQKGGDDNVTALVLRIY